MPGFTINNALVFTLFATLFGPLHHFYFLFLRPVERPDGVHREKRTGLPSNRNVCFRQHTNEPRLAEKEKKADVAGGQSPGIVTRSSRSNKKRSHVSAATEEVRGGGAA